LPQHSAGYKHCWLLLTHLLFFLVDEKVF